MDNLQFKSLSVLDFIAELENYDIKCKSDLIFYITNHKEKLKKILKTITPDSPYYGCELEIEHLVDFCKKLLYYIQSKSEPFGVSTEDFDRIKDILNHYSFID